MANNKRKKKRKRLKLYHLIILFFLVYISMVGINQYKLKKELLSKQNEIESEISVLQSDIEDLNIQIENKGTLEFLEDVAREELGMMKDNEIIYIDKARFKNSIYNFFNKSNDWHKLVSNIY